MIEQGVFLRYWKSRKAHTRYAGEPSMSKGGGDLLVVDVLLVHGCTGLKWETQKFGEMQFKAGNWRR